MDVELQSKLRKSLQILQKYDWLLDAYVLDFYVEEHWSKLPPSWRSCLNRVEPEKLSELLESTEGNCAIVWPLELLALRQLLNEMCLHRQPMVADKLPHSLLVEHRKLKHMFTKCVKPKKRHELQRMAAVCKSSQQKTNVDFVVDFGAGLGHLARLLGYGYGIRVCCLEMQSQLNEQAQLIDAQLESLAAKHLSPTETAGFQRPTHVTLCLTAAMTPHQFLATIKRELKIDHDNFRFGIIGLHPCGDLGVILMRMFLNCTQAKFLHFVGCCYMKLTTMANATAADDDAKAYGYPVSDFMKRQGTYATLSHEAREISCHACEVYCDRLRQCNYENLRVHSYRAAAERILCAQRPALKRCGLRSVKHTPGQRFEDYFYKAVQGLSAENLPSSALDTAATKDDLLHWKRVVVFYTLRLMLAPLVESVILYDRILYLRENGCHVEINAIFEPRLSPRNHITSAYKVS